MDVAAGTLTALYLFDVAEQIDLPRVRDVLGAGVQPRLPLKSAAPAYLQYQVPPLVVDGDVVGVTPTAGFSTRLKFFDYGVMSLAFSRPFKGSWAELTALGQEYIENPTLEAAAEEAVRRLVARCGGAMAKARTSWLSEDYLVVAVHDLAGQPAADQLLAARGAQIAQLLRGESQPLSAQEQEEVLRNRLSYLASDLVVPTWNAAFVYDTEAGAAAALELFEFANSQLLEFRYYDELLTKELENVYDFLEKGATGWWSRWRTAKAASKLHTVLLDVNELTERADNAIKFLSDMFSARLYKLCAQKVGVPDYKDLVQEKLHTAEDLYRFMVEQFNQSRAFVLELMVVVILIVELVYFFKGKM